MSSVQTASGDITVTQSDLAAVSLGTASGNTRISAALSSTEGPGLQAISGDIALAVPPTSRLTAEFQTISGDLKCRLPHETERRGRRVRPHTIYLPDLGDETRNREIDRAVSEFVQRVVRLVEGD